MAPKKPKPTRLQQKAAQKNKVLTGPKGSKPQGTTTNRVRTQGGTTVSKPKPAPSAGRRVNPKAAKPAPAKPAAKPARPSIGNVRGPATSPKRPTRPSIGNVSGPASSPRRPIRPSIGNVSGPASKPTKPSTGTTSAQRIQNRANAGVGRGAKELAALKGGAKLLGKAALPVAIAAQAKDVVGGFQKLANSPLIKGRPKPATPKPAAQKGPTAPQRQALDSQERKARQKLSARKAATKSSSATPNTAASFDSAFKDARRAKVKTFTWRGKKYTTQVK